MTGKQRCKILKDIRKGIAEENGIEFITSECKHKGDCLGTCPKCESELRYLEKEIERRRKLGNAITVAGLAVGMTLSLASCDDLGRTTDGVMMPPERGTETYQYNFSTDDYIMGDFAAPELSKIALDLIESPEDFSYASVLCSYGGRGTWKNTWAEYFTSSTENADTYTTDDGICVILTFDDEGKIVNVKAIKEAEETELQVRGDLG